MNLIGNLENTDLRKHANSCKFEAVAVKRLRLVGISFGQSGQNS